MYAALSRKNKTSKMGHQKRRNVDESYMYMMAALVEVVREKAFWLAKGRPDNALACNAGWRSSSSSSSPF